MQRYEESLLFLGTEGPFQRRVILVLCLAVLPAGFNSLTAIFLTASPSHSCLIPAHLNLSPEWRQASIPAQVGGQSERSRCSRYDLDMVKNLSALGITPNQSGLGSSPEASLKLEECKDGWTYSTEYYESTIVTEFNLVCRDQWKQPLTCLIYFIGVFFGCFVFGRMSDRFGRKLALFGAMAISSISNIGLFFVPSWPILTVLFFFAGMGQMANYIIVFTLGSELLSGPTRIRFCSLYMNVTYAIATILQIGTVYLFGNWRYLSIIMAVVDLLCMPLWWCVLESPRWLVFQGRLKEAEQILRSAAEKNGVEAPPVIFASSNIEGAESRESESLSFLDLLKTPNIRNISVILWLIWFSVGVGYYGLSFNMSSLNGNPFLNFSLLYAVEIPSYIVSWICLWKLRRWLPFVSLCLLGALAMLFIQFTLQSQQILTLSLVLLGKFGILSATGILYISSVELSPTVIRNTAMSTCSMFNRVGCAVSPYLMELAVFNQYLPWIAVGVLSLLSVVVSVFLPETFGQPLPDTIEQVPQAGFRLLSACKTCRKNGGETNEEKTSGGGGDNRGSSLTVSCNLEELGAE